MKDPILSIYGQNLKRDRKEETGHDSTQPWRGGGKNGHGRPVTYPKASDVEKHQAPKSGCVVRKKVEERRNQLRGVSEGQENRRCTFKLRRIQGKRTLSGNHRLRPVTRGENEIGNPGTKDLLLCHKAPTQWKCSTESKGTPGSKIIFSSETQKIHAMNQQATEQKEGMPRLTNPS